MKPPRYNTPQHAPYHRLGLALVPLDGGDGIGVEITINDKPLRELVRDAEARFGGSLAGRYAAASLEYLQLIEACCHGRHRHSSPCGFASDCITLLVCPCGDSGCWSLHASVRDDGETVSWTDFVSTLSRRHPGADYGSMDPLVFERRAYFKAVARLQPGIRSVVEQRNAAWADEREARRRARGRM